MSERWKSGSSRAYREARLLVMKRDNWRCRLRLPGCTGRATDCHHTGARELTGDNPETMLASCESCNNKVGDPTKVDPKPRPRTKWM